MTVTDTLDTEKDYETAGFNRKQAEAMASIDDKHAALTFQSVRAAMAADFKSLEARIDAACADFHSTARQQTWAIIGFGVAVAAIAVTAATLLNR